MADLIATTKSFLLLSDIIKKEAFTYSYHLCFFVCWYKVSDDNRNGWRKEINAAEMRSGGGRLGR